MRTDRVMFHSSVAWGSQFGGCSGTLVNRRKYLLNQSHDQQVPMFRRFRSKLVFRISASELMLHFGNGERS